MQAHTTIGAETLREVARRHPFATAFLHMAIDIARHHHERWDGTGYPDKLAGEAIPLLARVLALADAVDAMMSPRRYRPARSPLDIDAVVEQEKGGQFDPSVVAAFTAVRGRIYPPIYQKGLGESAYHAIDTLVKDQTETAAPLPDAGKK